MNVLLITMTTYTGGWNNIMGWKRMMLNKHMNDMNICTKINVEQTHMDRNTNKG